MSPSSLTLAMRPSVTTKRSWPVASRLADDRGEHVAVGAVALQDRLARRVDLRQRHGRADQSAGECGDLRLGIGGDALDRDAGDADRPVRHFGAGRRRRRDDRAGGDGGRCRRQDARDRRALRHRVRRHRLRIRGARRCPPTATYRRALGWCVWRTPPPDPCAGRLPPGSQFRLPTCVTRESTRHAIMSATNRRFFTRSLTLKAKISPRSILATRA